AEVGIRQLAEAPRTPEGTAGPAGRGRPDRVADGRGVDLVRVGRGGPGGPAVPGELDLQDVGVVVVTHPGLDLDREAGCRGRSRDEGLESEPAPDESLSVRAGRPHVVAGLGVGGIRTSPRGHTTFLVAADGVGELCLRAQACGLARRRHDEDGTYPIADL